MAAPSSSFNASSIPIIDLERARSGAPEEVTRAAQEVYLAFKNVGFAYIKNHGVPQELIDEAFEWVWTSTALSFQWYKLNVIHGYSDTSF
jgi:isopenicillin N synthase-like dioxygenase